MKKYIILISMTCMALLANSQNANRKYVAVDEKVQESSIQTVAKKYAKGDPKVRGAYEEMLRKTFEEYFNNGNVAADVVEADTIKVLNQQISSLENEAKALRKENNGKGIADQYAVHRAKVREQDSIMDSRISAAEARVGELNSLLAEARKLNAEYEQEVKNLGQSAAVADNVSTQLNDKEEALDMAYRECANTSLDNMRNLESKRTAVKEYQKYIQFLNITPASQKDNDIKIKRILALCDATEFYNKCKAALAKPYSRSEVAALDREGGNVRNSLGVLPGGNVQATELQNMLMALRNEGKVVAHFRNDIIAPLYDEGSIPNDVAKEEDLTKINNALAKFSANDPNRVSNSYNPKYSYINGVLDELCKAIRDFKRNRFDDSKVFGNFLNKVSGKLGDSVKSGF